MKILINTITYEQLYAEQELNKDFIGVPTITSGKTTETFHLGEWVHVPDDFVVPKQYEQYIKAPETILEERTQKVLQEHGLDSFALAIKETATLYSKTVAPIAETVLKAAPALEVKIAAEKAVIAETELKEIVEG